MVVWNGATLPATDWPGQAGEEWLRFTPGFFETMRVTSGTIPMAVRHYARIEAGAAYWRSTLPGRRALFDCLEGLANGASGRMRLQFGYRSDDGGLDWLAVFEPESNKAIDNIKTCRLGIYKTHKKPLVLDSNLKSNNRDVYLMARNWMLLHEWDEALVLNETGTICDATIANVWWLENSRVFTPPLSSGCVAGVMRAALLEVLPAQGWTVREEEATLERLVRADALFLTNAVRGVVPVTEFEGRRMESAAIAKIADLAREGLLARCP